MRKSIFDGSFYPSGKAQLVSFIEDALNKAEITEETKGAYAYVVPHAGYTYSGKTAAFTYKALKNNPKAAEADAIVLIGPNHTGNGRPISVSMEDWETRLGKASNDRELSKTISENSEYIEIDENAHEGEHSIEVQLPFLQYLFPKKKFVFICMGDQSIEASQILSSAIINAVEVLKRKIVVIASSDFDHYEPAEIARRKDTKLFEEIEKLDYKRFSKLVHELNDSICGFGPITVAMIFAKHAGSKKGVVLKYANSGEETHDYSSVVAYASIAFI